MIQPRELLLTAFGAALDAANPQLHVPANLPPPPKGRTLVIGGGKAAAAMAKAVEDNWPAEARLSGLVATRYQHGLPAQRIEVVEAGHPFPDDHGAEAAQRMLDEVRLLTHDDLLLVLLSGGGSSLLSLPADGIRMEELRELSRALLSSGAAIQEINAVRKHLTRFSGGQVPALSKAPVLSLIISDVVGNEPTNIASGPCAPDPSTYADALELLQHYGINPPPTVSKHLQRGLSGEIPDTPKPGNPIFRKVANRIIANAGLSLAAAQKCLEQQGLSVISLGEIEGESSRVAAVHASLIRQHLAGGKRPFALLSGGETTVTVRYENGRGGRNTEYLLALGLALRDMNNIWSIACDTDGIDGTEYNAGAMWTPDTLMRARAAGVDAAAMLEANDAYGFFSALDDLVVTGPTRTNVNDFRLVLLA